MKNYGKVISELRKQKGLTQEQLGKKLNVTYQAVSKWENNLSEPDLGTLEKLAEVFEISISDFFSMTKENSANDKKIVSDKKTNSAEKNIIKTKPWILISILSIVAVALLFVAIFVPFKLSAEMIFDNVSSSIFCIKTQTLEGGNKNGTGFFIDNSGLAVVDYDVVENCVSGYIKFDDEKTYQVNKLVGIDQELGVALIQINIEWSQAVKTANSDKVSIADKVYTIGYSSKEEKTLAETMISKVNYSSQRRYFQILTTSARDGSVLVNEQGKAVGVVSGAYFGDAGMDIAIPINEVFNVTKDINLTLREYAISKNGVYKIEFNGNGATDGVMLSQEIIRNSYEQLNKNSYEKVGYEFSGWSYNGNLYQDEQKVYNIALAGETIIFDAVWEAITYDVTYFTNGGENDQNNISHFTCEDQNFLLNEASLPGYTFEGWYEDEAFSSEKVDEIDTSVCRNVVLYAKYKPIEYHITYNLNANESAGENPETYTVESENIILLAAQKNGFEFHGWFADPKFETQITEIDCSSMQEYELYPLFISTTDIDGARALYTKQDLLHYLQWDKYSDNSKYKDYSFVLCNDIDLEGSDWYAKELNGNFFGNGHTISNFTIKGGYVANSNNIYAGFFGIFGGEKLEGLHIDNVLFQENVSYHPGDYEYSGVLAAYVQPVKESSKTIIKNCSVTNVTQNLIFSDSGSHGGLIGKAINTDIIGCSADVATEIYVSRGVVYLGGLVGYITCDLENEKCIISNCYATKDYSDETSLGNDYACGGLIGYAATADISNCYTTKNIIFKGQMIGYGDFGGLIAMAYNSNISNCYTTSSIYLYNSSYYKYGFLYASASSLVEENVMTYEGATIELYKYSEESTIATNSAGTSMANIWASVCEKWDSDVWNLYTNQNPILKRGV